jgi:hypothetical protein
MYRPLRLFSPVAQGAESCEDKHNRIEGCKGSVIPNDEFNERYHKAKEQCWNSSPEHKAARTKSAYFNGTLLSPNLRRGQKQVWINLNEESCFRGSSS